MMTFAAVVTRLDIVAFFPSFFLSLFFRLSFSQKTEGGHVEMKQCRQKKRAKRRRREGRERRSNRRGDVSSGWEDVLCDLPAMRDIGTTEKRCWAAPAIEGGFVVGDATANPTANE
tara:strand:+ start:102 stop:449 length:348 start_codon:yes stop_codon:yes gene_type:complete